MLAGIGLKNDDVLRTNYWLLADFG